MKKLNEMTGIAEKESTVALDLGDFETHTTANNGVDFAVIDPRTGDPSATIITLLGKDSDTYMEYKDAADKDMQERFVKAVAQSAKHAADASVDTKTEREVTIDELVVLTKGWHNVFWHGKELTFSKENARMLYTENAIVRAQVKRFVEDRSNFFPPASSKTSVTA